MNEQWMQNLQKKAATRKTRIEQIEYLIGQFNRAMEDVEAMNIDLLAPGNFRLWQRYDRILREADKLMREAAEITGTTLPEVRNKYAHRVEAYQDEDDEIYNQA